MYRIFDILLDSNIPIPELPDIKQGEPSISFQLFTEPLASENSLEWFYHWRLPNGEITISCAKLAKDYYLRFPHLADFQISKDGRFIQGYSQSGVTDESIRHLLIDQVIPRVVAHQGDIVLHASAIEIEGSIVAFLGESGWGKSTLATSFSKHGYSLLTDDCILLREQADKVIGIPAYAGSRLWSDSHEALIGDQQDMVQVADHSSKKRLIIQESVEIDLSGLPLRAILVLASPGEDIQNEKIHITEISGVEKVLELLKHSFLLDSTDKRIKELQFVRAGEIAATDIPIKCISYPRRHDLLPKVHEIIMEFIKKQ